MQKRQNLAKQNGFFTLKKPSNQPILGEKKVYILAKDVNTERKFESANLVFSFEIYTHQNVTK